MSLWLTRRKLSRQRTSLRKLTLIQWLASWLPVDNLSEPKSQHYKNINCLFDKIFLFVSSLFFIFLILDLQTRQSSRASGDLYPLQPIVELSRDSTNICRTKSMTTVFSRCKPAQLRVKSYLRIFPGLFVDWWSKLKGRDNG